jgi:LPPG:FO 2-phospho-L-lactate transferase
MRVTLICGGLGGARLAPHLARAHELTAICNVADDCERFGLRVCPDLDAVLYALGGVFDEARGYGIRGDGGTFMADAAAGAQGWFWIGDRDLRTHRLRTALLGRGWRLSEAVAELGRRLGVAARVLPATDDPVRTRVVASGRELDFQSYYVREGARPGASGLRWEGIERAAPAPGVLEAIAEADLVVIGESSPAASVLPVLQLTGVRETLAGAGSARVALSPVVTAAPPAVDPDRHHWRARERLLAALGVGHDPASVAGLYRGLIDAFVLDRRDAALASAVAASGARPRTADLLDRSAAGRRALVRMLEELAGPTASSEAPPTPAPGPPAGRSFPRR